LSGRSPAWSKKERKKAALMPGKMRRMAVGRSRPWSKGADEVRSIFRKRAVKQERRITDRRRGTCLSIRYHSGEVGLSQGKCGNSERVIRWPEGDVKQRRTSVGSERLDAPAPSNGSPVNLEPDTDLDEPGRAALAPEGFKRIVWALDGSVAAENPAGKEEADLRQGRERPRDNEPAEDVLVGVIPELAERNLSAGDDDGLAEVLEKEREGRGGERHGVGAVEEEEAVELGVIQRDIGREPDPVCGKWKQERPASDEPQCLEERQVGATDHAQGSEDATDLYSRR
jgi:hypothetical protein